MKTEISPLSPVGVICHLKGPRSEGPKVLYKYFIRQFGAKNDKSENFKGFVS